MPTMRSPEGKVYDVADEEVETLQRDQGWTLGPEAPTQPSGPSAILKSKDGRLYEAKSREEFEQLQRDQDMVLASPQETAQRAHSRELYGKYGGTGQQALGLAEAFYRNASLGVIDGLIGDEQEQRERAGVTRQESPVLYAGASAAPAIAAGIATGGAGLGVAGTIAAEGALGGLAGYSSESDAAFIEDRELSSEQAWGAFGKGALLGAGAAGAFIGTARALNPANAALRNRFAEAAGKAERRAEKRAFRGVGIDDPVDGLADAVVKPGKAAEMRDRGRAAATQVREEFGGALTKLEEVEQAARRWTPDAAEATGDAALQRSAIRQNLDSLRKDLEPIARPEERGLVSRAFDMIDRAESPADLYTAVQISKRAFADSMGAAGDKATAEALERGVKRLDELENNTAIFGAPAEESAKRSQALSDLGDARQALQEQLSVGNYLEVTGMRKGKAVDEALDTYIHRLGEVVTLSKGMPEAAEAKKAFAHLQSLREGPLRKVAALNQVDAISALDIDDVRPRGPSGTAAVLDIAEQAAKFGAAPQYMAYKVAKLAWKARKLATAAPGQRAKVAGDLAVDAYGMVDPIVGPVKLAYKYRHHIAVLAETAKDEAEAAAKQMVSAVRREGAVPLAERYAKEAFGEAQYNETRKAIETLIKEPDRLAEKLSGELGHLAQEAPDLVMDLNARGAAAVQFLSSKLPASYGFSLTYPDGPPPARSDMVEMSLYLRGATQPTEVVQAIADGSVMPEEIEAFRAVYPKRFAELQRATHTEVQIANQEGVVIPASRIAMLETVLDMPGQLDPTFSDDVALIVQGVNNYNAQQEAAASYVPPPKAGKRIAPTGDQVA